MSNSLFLCPTASSMKAFAPTSQQANAPSGSSSMFNHGRKQRFLGNEISSAAGNIIIIKMNEPLKGKDVTPGPLTSSSSQDSSVTAVSGEGYDDEDDDTDESDDDVSAFKSSRENISRPLRYKREPRMEVPSKIASGKRTRPGTRKLCKRKKLRLDSPDAPEQDEEPTGENSIPSPVTAEAEVWVGSRENRVDIISTRNPIPSSPPEFERHNSTCQTYTKHMLMYRHGFPLWSPQPDCSLHVDYRTNGVNVGDVGIITLDGGFDFLFNIWLPATHPIQPTDLLDDFDVLERPKRIVFRQNGRIGANNSMCYGAFNSTINCDTGGLEFVCHEDEGSILALPDGASREDLKNERNLEDFIRKSAESWYQYATGPADRLIDRNSLYLVTGWMKAKAWGMATYNKRIPSPYNTITLLKTNDQTMPRYFWDRSGGTMATTGPPPDEELDSRGIRFENQTLFIRGFKISLSEAAWADLQTGEAPLTSTTTSSLSVLSPSRLDYFAHTSVFRLTTPSLGDNKSSSSSPPGGFSRSSEIEAPPKELGNSPSLTSPAFKASQVREQLDLDGARVIVEKSSTPKLEHPSDVINDLIFRMVPQARVSLVHDNDWSDVVLKHGAEALYDKASLFDHVRAMYNVHYSGGLAVLRKSAVELSGDLASSQGIRASSSPDLLLYSNSNEFNIEQPQDLDLEWSHLFPNSSTQPCLEPNSADLHDNTSTEVVDHNLLCPVPAIVVSHPPEEEPWQISLPYPSDVNDLNFTAGIHDNLPGLMPGLVSSSTFSSSDYSETPSLDLSTPYNASIFESYYNLFSNPDHFDINNSNMSIGMQGDSPGPTPDLVSSSTFTSPENSETPSLELCTPSSGVDTFDTSYWPEDESPLFKDLEPRHESKDQTSASPMTPVDYWDIFRGSSLEDMDNCS